MDIAGLPFLFDYICYSTDIHCSYCFFCKYPLFYWKFRDYFPILLNILLKYDVLRFISLFEVTVVLKSWDCPCVNPTAGTALVSEPFLRNNTSKSAHIASSCNSEGFC